MRPASSRSCWTPALARSCAFRSTQPPAGASRWQTAPAHPLAVPGTLLGLYFGDICSAPVKEEYALELPHFWSGDARLNLFVDAAASCTGPDPSPANAAMYAHSCRDATVALSVTRLGSIPCVIAKSRSALHGGQALTWNYDGHSRGSTYTIDRRRHAELLEEGTAMVQCACSAPGPCPRSRWLLDSDFARP